MLILIERPIIEQLKISTGRLKIKNIVVIGDGIAAWCLIHRLGTLADVKIQHIAANQFFKPCSFTSTAINCLRGTRPGISELGDIILKSMSYFEEVNQAEQFAGVEEGLEYQIFEQSTIYEWKRRYPDYLKISDHPFLNKIILNKKYYFPVKAFFIDTKKLRQELISPAKHYHAIKDTVLAISKQENGYDIKGLNGDYHAGKVYICANHLSDKLIKEPNEKFSQWLKNSKAVRGSYLEIKGAAKRGFTFDHSFILAIEFFHFIYRKTEDVIQIGSSSNQDSIEIPDLKSLQEIYSVVDTHTSFVLPEFSDWEAKVGVRYKGTKRMPFWGKADDHELYAVCALYKNAFSYGFQAAVDLVEES